MAIQNSAASFLVHVNKEADLDRLDEGNLNVATVNSHKIKPAAQRKGNISVERKTDIFLGEV